jgi:hypothetical protein
MGAKGNCKCENKETDVPEERSKNKRRSKVDTGRTIIRL